MPLMWDNVTEIKCNIFARVWLYADLNVYRCIQGERDITPHVYVGTYTIAFHFFLLWCLVLFVEL